jgi:hypothetical protein
LFVCSSPHLSFSAYFSLVYQPLFWFLLHPLRLIGLLAVFLVSDSLLAVPLVSLLLCISSHWYISHSPGLCFSSSAWPGPFFLPVLVYSMSQWYVNRPASVESPVPFASCVPSLLCMHIAVLHSRRAVTVLIASYFMRSVPKYRTSPHGRHCVV